MSFAITFWREKLNGIWEIWLKIKCERKPQFQRENEKMLENYIWNQSQTNGNELLPDSPAILIERGGVVTASCFFFGQIVCHNRFE